MNETRLMIKTSGEEKALFYWVSYSGEAISEPEIKKLTHRLSDSVDQEFLVNPKLNSEKVVCFKPGVTDNSASSFMELLQFEDLFKGRKLSVHSGEVYFRAPSDLKKIHNPLIQRVLDGSQIESAHTEKAKATNAQVSYFNLSEYSDEALLKLSQDNHWALTLSEMKTIQAHFGKRKASDVELEVLAQTWSEHCKHKIFAAQIDYEDETGKTKVDGLFKTFVRGPTMELQNKKPWLISVFKDNAGIVRFHKGVDLCIKVETHNSPSALDPYGGALTGILGVNRDILGTGLGARPVANTNVLCFGEPHEKDPLPVGLFHPSEVLAGVHHGIQDGGNKSGIPTINGAIHFDESFSGKPLVFCGTVGVLPQTVAGIPSASKGQRSGDLIVMVGGDVGNDGIHGATASSLALDDVTPSSMVQIGDPLTQKRMTDFLLEARDAGLYNSLTDNGAGGLSSSIGEMAGETGGAKVFIERVPLKYPGLAPWQIFVSESQERMTLSVPKENWEKLKSLALRRKVNATIVGEFTNSGSLEIFNHDEKIANLALSFLHDGLPKMELQAKYQPRKNAYRWKKNQKPKNKLTSAREALIALAATPTYASKERWVRQYDHEVQAATVVKPFEGVNGSAPNDGGVVWMAPHGVPGYEGFAVASGLCPELSEMDPGLMAKVAVDEAVRNVLVTGADPSKLSLIDNFCWPDPLPGKNNPDAHQKLGELVRTCRELSKIVLDYEMPLISGKDSMKNDYFGKLPSGEQVKISVLPTLLVTALAHHPDVRRVVKPHAKPGSVLYVLGENLAAEYFGVALSKHFEVESTSKLNWDTKKTRSFYETFYRATQSGLILSAHDLSEGGLLFAAFESLMLHHGGIEFEGNWSWTKLFTEIPGRILVSVEAAQEAKLKSDFGSLCTRVGVIDSSGKIRVKSDLGAEEIQISEVKKAWRGAV